MELFFDMRGMQEWRMKIAKNRKNCKKILVFCAEILYNVKGQKRQGKRMDVVCPFFSFEEIKEKDILGGK